MNFPLAQLSGSASRVALRAIAVAMLLVAGAAPVSAESSADAPKLPGRVAIAQKLNSQLPLDTMLRDEEGRVVRLGDYFKSGRPVILTFMYFRCPMLCSMVMDGATNAMTELKFDIGKDFDVVTISIDPRDKPEAAAEMKDKYVKRYGRLSAANGWHFLTGHDSAIKKVTDTVGFQYAYDAETDQFAHGAVLLVVTPQGRVSRYFYGFEYKPRDLRLALHEASQSKIGGAAEELLLLCFHYDPATGKYSRDAMAFVRAGGVATMLGLASFVLILLRRERRDAIHAIADQRTSVSDNPRRDDPRPGSNSENNETDVQ